MYSKRAKYILKQMNDVVMYIVHVLLCDRILILGTFLKSIDKKPIGRYLSICGRLVIKKHFHFLFSISGKRRNYDRKSFSLFENCTLSCYDDGRIWFLGSYNKKGCANR